MLTPPAPARLRTAGIEEPSGRGAPAGALQNRGSVTTPLNVNGQRSSGHLGAVEEGGAAGEGAPLREAPWSAPSSIQRASGIFRGLFSRNGATEAAHVNHRYSREERQRLRQFESIDYLAPSSRVYRRWLAAQPWGRDWDKWLMMILIGVAVGLVAFFLHFLIHSFAAIKYHGTR